jgi:hypothetical protein
LRCGGKRERERERERERGREGIALTGSQYVHFISIPSLEAFPDIVLPVIII